MCLIQAILGRSSCYFPSSIPFTTVTKGGRVTNVIACYERHKCHTNEITDCRCTPAFLGSALSTSYSFKHIESRKIRSHDPTKNVRTFEPQQSHVLNLLETLFKQLDAFYRFSRPHTIIGTIVGITSISLLPLRNASDLSPKFFTGLLQALISAVLMNVYIVGINQIFDIEIDKVNKPNLPLASGEYTKEQGITIITACCFLSMVMGIKSQSPPLLTALAISFLLGSAYSIDFPFLRWKQHAFLAATCILCVRAVLVQLAFFLHIQRHVLGRPAKLTKPVIFATVFMCFFSAVIALFKDIPDVDGDKHFGIQSFSVQLGQERVFWLCIKLLLVAYFMAMLVGVSSLDMKRRVVAVLGHGLLAGSLLLRAQSLNFQSKSSIASFYMFIWKLFYVEYFLIPFML